MDAECITRDYKRECTDDIKKTVIAFANTNGGEIWIGIDDNNTVVGIYHLYRQKCHFWKSKSSSEQSSKYSWLDRNGRILFESWSAFIGSIYHIRAEISGLIKSRCQTRIMSGRQKPVFHKRKQYVCWTPWLAVAQSCLPVPLKWKKDPPLSDESLFQFWRRRRESNPRAGCPA